MKWALGAFILVGVAMVLRRVLQIGTPPGQRTGGMKPLHPDLQAVYQPVALEVETQATILGISLNDAFEERDANRDDVAWHMVRLSAGEWDRLATILAALLSALSKNLAGARVVVPAHSILAERFKSQVMIDFVRMHELLDQLVFRPKLRFQLQIRLLRRATTTLTEEFRRTYRYAERTQDRSSEVWNRLDLYFHDFDLIAKESLLAFRALLACMAPDAMTALTADLASLVQHGVRTPSVTANR